MGVIAVQADNTVFRFGTQSLRVTTGDAGDNAIYPADGVTVQPEEPYTFSAYIKTDAPITDGAILLRVAQAGLLTPALAESVTVTDTDGEPEDGWLRLAVTFTCPSGVFSVRPIILYTGTTAGQVFYLDGVKFEHGDLASLWQENIVSTRAVVDQSGVMVDATQGGIWRMLAAVGGTRDTVQLGDHGLLFGGDTELFSDTANRLKVVRLRLTATDDASLASTDHALQIGADNSSNLALDANEIQARSNGAAAVLSLNEAGGKVSIGGGVASLVFGGAAFPASPASNDLFYRTDLAMLFRHDGTRWLCTCPHVYEFPTEISNISATDTDISRGTAIHRYGGSDVWIESMEMAYFVAGGATALGASHNWNVGVTGVGISVGNVTVTSKLINSGASGVWRRDAVTSVGSLLGDRAYMLLFATKTGTPGNLYAYPSLSYRVVAT